MRPMFSPVYFALVVMAGCVPAFAGGIRDQGSSRDVLRADEIRSVHVSNAYRAIELLRPEFLRSRGIANLNTAEPTLPVIYVNGVRFGELESLRLVRAPDVRLIRYLNAADATMRFGTGHTGGAILVKTWAGGTPRQ